MSSRRMNGTEQPAEGYRSEAAHRSCWIRHGLVVLAALVACTGVMCADIPLTAEEALELGVSPGLLADLSGGEAPEGAGRAAELAEEPGAGPTVERPSGGGTATPGTDSADRPAAPATPPTAPAPAPAQPATPAAPAEEGGADPNDGWVSPVVKPTGEVPQTQLKPIARWDVVPYQRINADGVFNCGVVAFSKFGISHVRFIINGQGYTGSSPVDVADMTLNEQTGVYEYWTPVYGSDFASDGPITVEAEVYGYDGGVRDKNSDGGGVGLDPLPLVVNPAGTLPQPQAWVSPGADDGGGVVDDPTRPFGTLGRAIDAIRQYRLGLGLGDNADGGIVRLTPGSHACSAGDVTATVECSNEWVTVTTAAGGTPENTVLLPGTIMPTRKIALQGITLQGAGTLGMSYNDRTQCAVWVSGCDVIGSGRGISTAHPLSSEYKELYYTESTITQVHQATSGSRLCRNLAISTISDDAFQNVPMVVNCVVEDVDPLGTGAHADVWQHGGGNSSNKLDDNIIVYNLVASGLKYQSIFIRPDIYSPPSMAQGMAFVNVYMEMLSDSHGWAGWGRWVDHLLWWHCSFTGKGMGIMSESYSGGAKMPCRITNISVRGCDFAFFGDGGGEVDWNGFDQNHFVDAGVTVGTGVTTGGDLLDAAGVPADGSPLIDRLDAVVPVDANNNVRGARADIGAFER